MDQFINQLKKNIRQIKEIASDSEATIKFQKKSKRSVIASKIIDVSSNE